MNHLTEDRAQELVDGMLPDDVRRGCELHLARCAECQAVVASFRALAEALEGLEAPPPPPDFTQAVMARIDDAERTGAAERHVLAGIAAAVALLAAVCVVGAGANAWAPTLAGLFDRLGGAITTVAVVSDVVSPILRALRVPIAVACLVVGLPILYALSRLVPRGAEVTV